MLKLFGGLIKSNYIPWHEIANVGMGQIVFNIGRGSKIKTYNYTMTPVSKFESLQDFEMRSRKFYFDFTPHLIEKKKHKSKAKKVQKVYDNLKAILGEEEFEFFRTNDDYEEFNKHLPKLEKAIVEAMPKWTQYFYKKINQ
jgi:hypothetical protein